ncbi:GldL-related protein [Winogradskyella ursingii]|uniref:GldL-related protein n=1 Tax=Winogradskyella ursingii TaxID=2686079 RepID=UPI0015CC10F8|nr:hypothetical protein [Winogradskyella ursingii]
MKAKLKRLIPALILFILGYGITIAGALFKIQHWPYGEDLLLIGSIFEIIAIIIAVIVLFKIYTSKD